MATKYSMRAHLIDPAGWEPIALFSDTLDEWTLAEIAKTTLRETENYIDKVDIFDMDTGEVIVQRELR